MKKDSFLAGMVIFPTMFVTGTIGFEFVFDPDIQKGLIELAKIALAALAVRWGLRKN